MDANLRRVGGNTSGWSPRRLGFTVSRSRVATSRSTRPHAAAADSRGGTRHARSSHRLSYARTGLAKSARGGFNMTPAMTMAAHAINHAVAKSGVEPADVEDVYLGNGAHGAGNLARLSGLLAGLPGHHGRRDDPAALLVGPQRHRPGRQLHQGGRRRRGRRRRRRVDLDAQPAASAARPTWTRQLEEMYPAIYMAMIETADIVAERYGVSREYQDEYSLQSQQRMAAAQAARAVRRRDRADGHEDEAGRQGDQGRDDRRLRRRPRRVQPARHHASRAWPSCSRCAARATTSPPATPASCPTAPPRSC